MPIEAGEAETTEALPEPNERAANALFGKTTRALLVMAALLAIPYASPQLRGLRVAAAPWDDAAGEVTEIAPTEPPPPPVPSIGETSLRATENQGTVTNALPAEKPERAAATPPVSAGAADVGVEDPTGHALDAFYRELARTERKDAHAVTRVLHYGDSVITSDLISGTLRRRFQERFGDAGHGFILTANPWEWYYHNDVTHSATDGWSISRITGPFSGDRIYGLGGVSFHAKGAAGATFGTASKGDYGRRASRYDVYYLEQPAGGDVDLVGRDGSGTRTERLSTRGPKKVSRVFSFQTSDGASGLTLRARGNGDVRVFGVAIERDAPGVAYDALGVNGARARLWEQMDAEHWREQMDLRKPALVILQYGTNESEGGPIHPESYQRQLGALIEKVKGATPNASVLIAAPMDRAEKDASGKLRTSKPIVQLVELQRKVAHEHQVAFFDTFGAMGGEGTFARWVKETPQLASWDLTHPTPAGAEALGNLMYKALMRGYEGRRQRH